MFDRFFSKGDAPAAPADAPTAAAPAAAAPTAAGDTATVRRIVGKLEEMPPERARLVASAAYILARAANADLDISDEETAVMEEALQRKGALDEATAVLVIEMAKLQAKTVGGTEDYVVTREFKSISTPEQRLNMARACFLIGAANGSISAEESAVANQIANELDIEDATLAALRAEFTDQMSAVQQMRRMAEPGFDPVALRIAIRTLLVAGIATVALAGCAASNEPSPADSIATFRVADGSTYKVLITDPGDLEIVDKLSKGEDAPSIPNGAIVRETGVNTEWSWSIDPTDFGFSDVVDADCQATPQEIEDGTFEGDRFCPWSAIVIALEPAP